jgi:2-keto-4-pentenoate hydratase
MAVTDASDRAAERPPIDAQAKILRESYARGYPIEPIRLAYPTATIDDAYSIQAANTALWQAEGRTIIGAKIGLTAKAVQRQLGVDQPDFGTLFSDMYVADGEEVAIDRLLQPKVEAEIAFVLKRSPDVTRLTSAELIDAVDFALPSIEIVDSRIAGWNIGIVDTVADNASSGLFVLGTTPVSLANIDLRLCGMVLEKNGEPCSFGAGAACLGNPLHALAWLARKMAECGQPLGAGHIVLSGALGPMVPVEAGDRIDARIEGVGSVSVAFGAR